MKVKNYFKLDKAPDREKFLIRADFNLLPLNSTKGSYAVICARLMGLKWDDYMRFCRDCLNAEIVGKNSTYPTIYFEDTDKVRKFIKTLNERAEFAMRCREMGKPEFQQKFYENLKSSQNSNIISSEIEVKSDEEIEEN